LGSILILWIPLFSYGSIKSLKCNLRLLLFFIGYTFNFSPILYQLISHFPKKSEISIWVHKHRYMYLLLDLLIVIENLKMCEYKGKFSIIILTGYIVIRIFLILQLLFIERNISETKVERKFIISTLYFDILYFILSVILCALSTNIKIKSYVTHFVIQTVNFIVISITNFIFLYCCRLFIRIKHFSLKIEEVSKNHFNFIIPDSDILKSNSISDNSNKAFINSNSVLQWYFRFALNEKKKKKLRIYIRKIIYIYIYVYIYI